ncbi:MAG: hypothetical protein Q8O40_08110 [Chloroflexota bacterium]|nr:hypothetical protein [Chloroflexota bacterium]
MASTHDVVSLGASLVALAVVAALARQAVSMALSNPIPWEDKQRLYNSYGTWAVNMAEAVCPTGDVGCVEREAQRFYEVRRSRRRT